MNCGFETYKRLLEDRPFKLAPDEVNYRAGEEHHCSDCIHFFSRKVDGFHTCEVMRPDDDAVESIIANYVCDLYTSDGEEYPYQEES